MQSISFIQTDPSFFFLLRGPDTSCSSEVSMESFEFGEDLTQLTTPFADLREADTNWTTTMIICINYNEATDLLYLKVKFGGDIHFRSCGLVASRTQTDICHLFSWNHNILALSWVGETNCMFSSVLSNATENRLSLWKPTFGFHFLKSVRFF